MVSPVAVVPPTAHEELIDTIDQGVPVTAARIYLNRHSVGAYPGTYPYWLSFSDDAHEHFDSIVESVEFDVTFAEGYVLGLNRYDEPRLFGPDGVGLTAVQALRKHAATIEEDQFWRDEARPESKARYLVASDGTALPYATLLLRDRDD